MIRVYKSDTGQFVLMHPSTQTVMIEENLQTAYEKMEAHLQKNHPNLLAETEPPFEKRSEPHREPFARARFFLYLFIVLLPFLWLVALHYTLVSLVDDVMVQVHREQQSAAAVEELRGELETLRLEVNRLGLQLSEQQRENASSLH